MSEQIDGHLQIPASYSFKREKLNNYRSNSINSQRFYQWVQNDMYRSSYAHHHSPVCYLLFRNLRNRDHIIFLVMAGSFPTIGLKVCMRRLLPIKQSRSSWDLKSIWIVAGLPLPDSISQKMPSLTSQRMLLVTSMARAKFKDPILGGW